MVPVLAGVMVLVQVVPLAALLEAKDTMGLTELDMVLPTKEALLTNTKDPTKHPSKPRTVPTPKAAAWPPLKDHPELKARQDMAQ
jgi:hypothetical protein